MKDTKKICVVVAVLGVLLLLFFFTPTPQETEREVISLQRNYTFENPDYRILEKENLLHAETMGLVLETPKEWSIERYKEELSQGVDIFTPSCSFYLTSYKEDSEIRYLKASINSLVRDELERESIGLVQVDGFYGIKKEEADIVKVPYKDRIYELGVISPKEDCQEDYYKLLQSLYFLDKNEK